MSDNEQIVNDDQRVFYEHFPTFMSRADYK